MSELRSYTELLRLSTFADRFQYLSLKGSVGAVTFGHDRYLNQAFYRSREWRQIRRDVILRDESRDLAVEGYEIYDRVYIHHMNAMTVDDLVDFDERVIDPEFLICVTHRTHNAIHYGDERQIPRQFVERQPGDTLLWKRS